MLEKFFQQYLQYLVSVSKQDFDLLYDPGLNTENSLFLASKSVKSEDSKYFELRVTSPGFFRRVFHYTSLQEALSGEALCLDEKARTVSVSHPDLISLLALSEDKVYSMHKPSTLLPPAWMALKALRCPPPKMSYGTPRNFHLDGIHGIGPLSNFDIFFFYCSKTNWMYRRLATKNQLAARCAFGMPGLVKLLDLAVRVALAVLSVHLLVGAPGNSGWVQLSTLGKPLSIHQHLVLNLIHCWALAKG